MRRTAVLNVVGLTPALLERGMPRLARFAAQGQVVGVTPPLPAVTCTVQASYVTGTAPGEHGIVANGWYEREAAEVRFWRQSNHLVQRPKLWQALKARDPGFTCANLFWWFNMYSAVDYAVTPRPMYPADGRKLPDVWTQPGELREQLQAELGQFPLFRFWGPATSLESSRWIAEAARWIEQRHAPTLSLVYLPHLDYNLQRFGPDDPRVAVDLAEIDSLCGDLADFYRGREVQVVALSEYGIGPVRRPVHLNRRLREAGLITVREELGHELLDAGASAAFAVADHQVAHVYLNEPSRLEAVRELVGATPGVAEVLDAAGKRERGLDHPRAGDLVAVAESDAWFTYYYWLDDERAPDFARTVDIHRKPGYDPAELFLDPSLRSPKLAIARHLLRSRLGFRSLLEVIPLRAEQVKGSHGRVTTGLYGPLLISERAELLPGEQLEASWVHEVLLRHVLEGPPVYAGRL